MVAFVNLILKKMMMMMKKPSYVLICAKCYVSDSCSPVVIGCVDDTCVVRFCLESGVTAQCELVSLRCLFRPTSYEN